MTGILITIISAGVCTAVGEEICVVLQKPDIAKWLRVAGVSLCAGLSVGLVIKLIAQVKTAFVGV